MLKIILSGAVSLLVLSGCAGGRGGVIDEMMDQKLYVADTKAERLLRYYQVQGLLVRYAAENNGVIAARNAVALANIAATAQLGELVACLRIGSAKEREFKVEDARDEEPVRVAYCSFFESRLVKYEDAIWNLMKTAIQYDDDALYLKGFVRGLNVLDFASVVSAFVRIAQRAIRDERLLRAFRTDALELQAFVRTPGLSGPEALATQGIDHPPEQERLDALRARTAAPAVAPVVVRAWHFREASSFMRSSCHGLNADIQMLIVKASCSSGIPFPPAPAKS